MGNIMGVELNLDQEYIKGAVEDIVKAGIVSALGDPSVIVKSALDKSINRLVDRNTGKETNSPWDGIPYLQYLANKTVENTVRKCMEEYIEQHQEEFRQEILRQFSSKQFKKDLAASFIQTITDASKSTYRMPIRVSFERPKDY